MNYNKDWKDLEDNPILWRDGFLKKPIGKFISWIEEKDGTIKVTISNSQKS